jgi:hypothetical protein
MITPKVTLAFIATFGTFGYKRKVASISEQVPFGGGVVCVIIGVKGAIKPSSIVSCLLFCFLLWSHVISIK